jgi:hypothetical protein
MVTMYLLSNMVGLCACNPISSRGNPVKETAGQPANLDLWGMNEMQSLYDGISTVQSILRGALSETTTRLVLCLGMQESTGDLKLNVPSGRSQVFMQVFRKRLGGF